VRVSFWIGITLTVLLVLASGVYWGYQTYEQSRDDQNPKGKLVQKINDEERIQLLLMHAPDDTLELTYLVSYDSLSGRLAAIYLPPEIKTMSPSYGKVLSLRELYDQFDEEEIRKELEYFLNLNIPFWIRTSGNDVRDLIDTMGGIQLEFPVRAEEDSDSSRTEERWLDGPQAQSYVREAYQRFETQGRRFRHKTLFMGLREKISDDTGFFRHPRSLDRTRELFESNLTRSDWHTLSHLMANLNPERVKFPSTLHLMKTSGEDNTLNPEPLKSMLPKPLKRMIQESDPKSTIDVQVLNGAGLPKLAAAVRDKLQPNPRVDVVETGNADRYNYETTQIIDRKDNPKSADHVRKLLGTGSIQSDPSEQLLVDVTVIVGKDLNNLIRPD
jgi:hypothetical protein